MPTTEGRDMGAIRALLLAAFRGDGTETFLRPDFLEWKSARPAAETHFLPGAAHVTVLRLPLTGKETAEAVTCYDWASVAPGAGRSLYLAAVGDRLLISIGGSAASEKTKERMGLLMAGRLGMYSRIMRPWQWMRSEQWSSRLPYRYARAVIRELLAPGNASPWRAEPVAAFGKDVAAVLSYVPRNWTLPGRSLEGINDLLRCPLGYPAGLTIRDEAGTIRGYSVLAWVGGQCRIADVLIASEEARDWRNGVAAVVRAARADARTNEISAAASSTLMHTALQASGLQSGWSFPVYSNRVVDLSETHLTLADGDLFAL